MGHTQQQQKNPHNDLVVDFAGETIVDRFAPAIVVLFDKDSEIKNEFRQLAATCGFALCAELQVRALHPDPQHYIHSGKLEELHEKVIQHKARIVMMDVEISAGQERNLQNALQCKILDRSEVILMIFALHAGTFESKLQVELAQLQRLSSRLVRGWSHLERQRGGIGMRGGPGERQLESDRRMVSRKLNQVKRRLQRVVRTRDLGRQQRKKHAVPAVVLVGRTNAGKSSVFNALTTAEVLAVDRLFATLGTTLRALQYYGLDLVLADTVGFIRKLPHELIASFHATLEEVKDADLLLQLTDITRPMWRDDFIETQSVLKQIGAENVPCLHVYNKIDCLDYDFSKDSDKQSVYVSAENGEGIDLLRKTIIESLWGDIQRHTITLKPTQMALRAMLHQWHAVINESIDTDCCWQMHIELPLVAWDKFRRRYLL